MTRRAVCRFALALALAFTSAAALVRAAAPTGSDFVTNFFIESGTGNLLCSGEVIQEELPLGAYVWGSIKAPDGTTVATFANYASAYPVWAGNYVQSPSSGTWECHVFGETMGNWHLDPEHWQAVLYQNVP